MHGKHRVARHKLVGAFVVGGKFVGAEALEFAQGRGVLLARVQRLPLALVRSVVLVLCVCVSLVCLCKERERERGGWGGGGGESTKERASQAYLFHVTEGAVVNQLSEAAEYDPEEKKHGVAIRQVRAAHSNEEMIVQVDERQAHDKGPRHYLH